MQRIRTLLVAVPVLLTCSGWLGGTSAGHAAESTSSGLAPVSQGHCEVDDVEQRAAGIDIQTFASTDVTGGLAGLPDRVITGLKPGEQGSFCVGFHNRTGGIIQLDVDVEDVGVNAAGAPQPMPAGEGKYGAAAWITLPTNRPIKVKHGELVWLTIDVQVPLDTTGGSNYAAITGTVEQSGTASGTQVNVIPSVAVQVFLDIAGDLDQRGELTDVSVPRVIWWDGAGIGDLPVLDRLRGRGIAPIRMDWRNTGSLTQRVGGTVTIESSLGGKDVAKLPIASRFVLRGATLPLTATWKRDIPIIGRFTPTVRVDAGNGTVVTRQLPAIWVIPAWWYLLLLAIAIAVPIQLRRRSKRRYRELLARLDAAEQREVSAHFDEYWEDEDSWSDQR